MAVLGHGLGMEMTFVHGIQKDRPAPKRNEHNQDCMRRNRFRGSEYAVFKAFEVRERLFEYDAGVVYTRNESSSHFGVTSLRIGQRAGLLEIRYTLGEAIHRANLSMKK